MGENPGLLEMFEAGAYLDHLSAKWANFGKQNWRCGMNQTLKLRRLNRRSLETRKGVGCYRQQGGGHGSRTSAKECVTTHLPKQLALKMDAAEASCLCLAVSGRVGCSVSRWRFADPVSPDE